MPRPRPGSWAWLLVHELRLLWRAFGVRSRIIAAIGIVFLILAHAGGYAMVRAHALQTFLERAPGSAIVVTVFVALLVVSSAFGLAVRVLLERGDLDLLMTSPVPMTTVYGVRGLTVAMASVGSMAVFLLPLANMGPFAGQWRTLAGWPALGAMGLLAAAIAFAVTLGLVGWLGLRRARVVSQLVGAFIGIGFLLAMQAEALLPRAGREVVHRWLRDALQEGWLGAESPLLWPLRAFAGELLPLVGLVGVGAAAFLGVILTTHGAFLRALQEAPTAGASRGRRARGGESRPFRAGLVRVVIAKELTLVRRDPALIARALLQVLYLVPLFVIIVRRMQPDTMLAAALVVLAASLAGTLAWITVSGEEAPELLGAAPVDLDRIRWLKVGAALLPVMLACAPFIGWFSYRSLATAAIAVVFIALALASSAVVQVWATPLGGGRDVRQRYRQNPFVNVADTLGSFAWALACYLALEGSPWAIAAIAAGCVAPAAAWLSGRRARA